MNKISYLLCSIILVFSSCSNDDGNDPAADNINEPALIANWRLVDWYSEVPIDINNDGNASTNLWDQWNGCHKFSILILNENGTSNIQYTGPANNPKCPPGHETDEVYEYLNWFLSDNDTVLNFDLDDVSDTHEIIELSTENLVLKNAGSFSCCDSEINYYTDGYLVFEKVSD